MKKYMVKCTMSYCTTCVIEASNKEEAEKKLREGIREGKYDPPENCVDSWCETERIFE